MNKDKNTLPNYKHLTLSDRTYIEQELFQKSFFTSIASNLKKDPTTIAKEIKRYSKDVPVKGNRSCIKCKRYEDCDFLSRKASCSHYNKKYCSFLCKKCYRYNPPLECLYYMPFQCEKIKKPPYVCNYCNDQKNCPLTKKIYDASHAQRQYKKTLVKSRQGINMTPEDFLELNELISPLIFKGQPLSHIFAVHADEIPVCRRTLYNYLDQRIFQARNIDLPRRVRYKKRMKKSVIHALDDLSSTLGVRLFRKYLPVLLTDNSSEFKNPWDIKTDDNGKHHTYVFYCDPYVSNQKARLDVHTLYHS